MKSRHTPPGPRNAPHGNRQGPKCAAAVAVLLFASSVLAADPPRSLPSRGGATIHAAIDLETTGNTASYSRHLAQLINEYRWRNGLGPLQLVSDLNAIASQHSTDMAQLQRLSHDGFMQRFDRTGAQLCVENVGVNFPHAEAQLDGWRASPGHHRNLLEPKVARMGIAKSRQFVTFFACS